MTEMSCSPGLWNCRVPTKSLNQLPANILALRTLLDSVFDSTFFFDLFDQRFLLVDNVIPH